MSFEVDLNDYIELAPSLLDKLKGRITNLYKAKKICNHKLPSKSER